MMDKEERSLREKTQYSSCKNQMPVITYAELLCAEVINHLWWGKLWGFREFPHKKPHSCYMTMGEGGKTNPYSILGSKELNFLLLDHITPVHMFYGNVTIGPVILYLLYSSIVSSAYCISARWWGGSMTWFKRLFFGDRILVVTQITS